AAVALVRSQHSRSGPADALVLSAAAHGVYGGGRVGPYGYRRHLLRQGISRPLGSLPRGPGLLGRLAVGVENAARPSGRSDLALEVLSDLFRRRTDCGQSADHGRLDRAS